MFNLRVQFNNINTKKNNKTIGIYLNISIKNVIRKGNLILSNKNSDVKLNKSIKFLKSKILNHLQTSVHEIFCLFI